MAWEWVSPFATASAGVVAGGIGIYFTWLTGTHARESQRADANEWGRGASLRGSQPGAQNVPLLVIASR
jgi:hypothetical protein